MKPPVNIEIRTNNQGQVSLTCKGADGDATSFSATLTHGMNGYQAAHALKTGIEETVNQVLYANGVEDFVPPPPPAEPAPAAEPTAEDVTKS